LKDEKLKDLAGSLNIWERQMNAKNGTATDEVIKEQAKVLGQQMRVTNFVH
jgi:hypothetical protein